MAGAVPKDDGREQKPQAFDSLLEMAAKAIAPILGSVVGEIVAPGGAVIAAAVGFNVKSAVGRGVGAAVEFAVERFGPPIVKIWASWFSSKRLNEQHAAFEATGRISTKDAYKQAEVLVERLAPPGTPAAAKDKATAFIAAIPGCVNRSLVPDKSGKLSVSPSLKLTDEKALFKAIPTSIPPYAEMARLNGTDFILEQLLGTGGFGAVYRAVSHTQQLADPVAIKFCTNPTMKDALDREKANLIRLRGAAKSGRGGWSPRIARLIGYNLKHDTPYLIYEFVEGGDLYRFLRERPDLLTHTTALQIIIQICEGLAFAHELGLVHRDLKPANVLIDYPQGRFEVKLTDFGISGIAALHSSANSASTPGQSERTPSISRFRGTGTPGYMSKEQARGDDPNPQHDVYSLGIMWYQLLLGDVDQEMHPGWEADLDEAHAPSGQIAIIKKCFSQPEKRPKDAGEILKLIHESCATVSPSRPRYQTSPVIPRMPDVKVAPINIVIPSVPVSQAPVSHLPPIPREVLKLEEDVQGIKITLDELQQETHPDLRASLEKLQIAETDLRYLEAEVEKISSVVAPGVLEQLKEKISADIAVSNAELCKLAPSVPHFQVLQLVQTVREAEKGRLKIAEARRVYTTSRVEGMKKLNRQFADSKRQLYMLQERDFEVILAKEFEAEATVGADFPIEKWVDLRPHLDDRRYGFATAEDELLAKAEAYFRGPIQDDFAWRRAKQQDTVAAYRKYLSHYGQNGRHRVKVKENLENLVWEAARNEDAEAAYQEYLDTYGEKGRYRMEAMRALTECPARRQAEEWDEAKEKGDWEAISAYLTRYPEGPRDEKERGELATRLRVLLLNDPTNIKLRIAYLKGRTETNQKADSSDYNRFLFRLNLIISVAAIIICICLYRSDLSNATILNVPNHSFGLSISNGTNSALRLIISTFTVIHCFGIMYWATGDLRKHIPNMPASWNKLNKKTAAFQGEIACTITIVIILIALIFGIVSCLDISTPDKIISHSQGQTVWAIKVYSTSWLYVNIICSISLICCGFYGSYAMSCCHYNVMRSKYGPAIPIYSGHLLKRIELILSSEQIHSRGNWSIGSR